MPDSHTCQYPTVAVSLNMVVDPFFGLFATYQWCGALNTLHKDHKVEWSKKKGSEAQRNFAETRWFYDPRRGLPLWLYDQSLFLKEAKSAKTHITWRYVRPMQTLLVPSCTVIVLCENGCWGASVMALAALKQSLMKRDEFANGLSMQLAYQSQTNCSYPKQWPPT